jgi:hypothetical protein
MGPHDEDQDVTSQAARRRRVLVGLLAGAAIAVPGVALATSGGSSDRRSGGDTPSLSIRDDQGGARHDGRNCPRKHDGSANPASEQRDL